MKQDSILKRNWSLGLVMLFFVVISWVSSSFLLNTIFESNYYKKPIFITFCSVSSCSLYLLPLLRQFIKLYFKTGQFDIQTAYKLHYNNNNNVRKLSINEQYTMILNEKYEENIEQDHKEESIDQEIIPLSSIIKLSIIFCTLWFGANVTTNTSLSYTSVTSQTILSSTASFFTLFFGVLLGIDTINIYKLIGLIVSFIGIIIIVTKSTVSNSTNFNHLSYKSIIIGNILALLGALIYGIYSTFFKRSVLRITEKYSKYGIAPKVDVKLFLGFVGLFTFVGLWPILVVFHYTGFETFQFKFDIKIISIILLNCSITFLSDYCWAKAIILTTPLTVTVGLSFTIPLAMFGDFIFKGKKVTLCYVVGAILIFASFILINRNDASIEEEFEQQTLLKKTISNSYGSIEV
ncbi:thiamine-repressible mitochondrial transport protein Thi74p [Monosporozyma unispora]